MSILKVEDLVKIYGGEKGEPSTEALSKISFEIEKGEFVGIMGPSGSGKTTLLNLLSGIDKSTSGSIKINNNDMSSMDKNQLSLFRRKEIGFVFQDFNLLDSLTIKENIELPMILDKRTEDEMEEQKMRWKNKPAV